MIKAKKKDRIHPWIPRVYNDKIMYIQIQTGYAKEDIITIAIYVFLSYVWKKVNEGKDLLTVVAELYKKTEKNIEYLENRCGDGND